MLSQPPKVVAVSRINSQSSIFALLAITTLATAAGAQGSGYSVQRHGQASISGVSVVRVENGSGHLVIRGRQGASMVSSTASVHGSQQDDVDGVKLITERQGDAIVVRAVRPDQGWRWGMTLFRGRRNLTIDLTVDVPPDVHLALDNGSGDAQLDNVGPVTLDAGSGDVRMRGVNGAAKLSTGSGGADLSDIHGDVVASTGSGELTIAGVTGSVEIRDAGSGGINIRQVSGGVHLGDMGSGGVTADNVGGDLTVDSKGSGSVSYTNIKGRVSVPGRGRNR